MRGIYNSVTDIRRKVFAAIAKMAYDDNTDYAKRIEEIPYEILPGTKAKYRNSIFLERAIIGERLRLGMGLPVREMSEYGALSDGIEESTIAKKYYDDPLINIVKFACNACPEKKVFVTNACQGCLSHQCTEVCPKDAIHIVDGIALVDKEVCKACGKCVAACPKHLIELVPYSAKHIVQCSSKDVGKNVMKACSVGCIGCHLCEKNCPKDAVHVIDNVAYIDQEKCVGCGICAQKCPKKIIL